MKVLNILLVVFSMLVAGSLAAISQLPVSKSLDKEGFCYHKEMDLHVMKGKSEVNEATCETVTCLDDYTMTVSTCGLIRIEDPTCKKWELGKFPKCCQPVCVERVKN